MKKIMSSESQFSPKKILTKFFNEEVRAVLVSETMEFTKMHFKHRAFSQTKGPLHEFLIFQQLQMIFLRTSISPSRIPFNAVPNTIVKLF